MVVGFIAGLRRHCIGNPYYYIDFIRYFFRWKNENSTLRLNHVDRKYPFYHGVGISYALRRYAIIVVMVDLDCAMCRIALYMICRATVETYRFEVRTVVITKSTTAVYT